MRTKWLGILAVLCGSSLAQAQQYPAYYNGGYYPSYPQQAQYGYNPYQAGGYSPYGSNYNYQRYNYNPYGYALNPGAGGYYYPQQSYPQQSYPQQSYPQQSYPQQGNVYYMPTSSAPTTVVPTSPPATVVPAEPPIADPYNPYRYVAQELQPPPVMRHEEPVYQASPLLDDPIAFHRPCKDLFWFSADYIAAFIRPMQVSGPLVTTGSTGDTEPAAIGQPHTAVLFGGSPIDFGVSNGMKFTTGMFLDRENHFSIDFGGFFLLQNTNSYSTASDGGGNPVVGRPIFNTQTLPPGPGNNAVLNSFPTEAAGTINIDAKSQLWGLELNGRYHAYCWGNWHFETLFGLRYVNLSESLAIRETISPLQNDGFVTFQGNGVSQGSTFHDLDSFSTTNQFYGAQIGGSVAWEYRWLSLEAFGKLALGVNSENVIINGLSGVFNTSGVNPSTSGGVLALPSNIGDHNRNVFAVLPELGINVGIDVCDHVRLNLGYSCLMWNQVARPGDVIPTSVNAGQIPGSPTFGLAGGGVAPTFHYSDEFFFVHQFNVGLQFIW